MLKDIEQTLRSHPFVTSWFLQNTYIQTLFMEFFPFFKAALPKKERRYITAADGSRIAADCWWQKDKDKHSTVVILSGYEGYRGSQVSQFAKSMCMKAYYRKYNVIHLRQRAEGDTLHLTNGIAYVLNDIPLALKAIIAWGIPKFYLTGFSIGAYNILFALGKLRDELKKNIIGAVAISAPTTITDSWEFVEKNPFYNYFLLRFYKNLIQRRIKIDPPGTWDVKQLQTIKTKRQFAETYMNRWGHAEKFASFEGLNKKTDVVPLLPFIKIPTLLIHAHDDLLVSLAPFTKSVVKNNPHIITLLTKHGGHGGFFTLKPKYGDLDGHWAQNRALEFIRLLEEKNS